MDIPFMASRTPQPLHLRTARRFGAGGRFVLLALLGLIAAASAQAQVVVGGDRAPSISVDLTVLDKLGPAPTLPQLFGAARNADTDAIAQPPAVSGTNPVLHRSSTKGKSLATKRTKTHHVARRATRRRTRLAHARTSPHVATASNANIHLVSPATQAARPVRSTRAEPAPIPAIRRASAVALTPPPSPPMPKLPQAAAAPSTPTIAPSQPPEEPPAAPQPQSQAHAEQAPISMMATPPSTDPQAAADTAIVPHSENAAPAEPPHVAPVQVASAGVIGVAPSIVKFAPGNADLPPASQPVLNTVAAKLLASDGLRVQLVAHATGGADQAMEARRISLARAVAVRAYLIDKGVRSLRMDVRALGNRADDGPVDDQVDLVIVSQ
jgi:outer membrane protein OmpA-like peptidoglycan-associated protein